MIRDLSKEIVKPLNSTTGIIYAILSNKPKISKKTSKLPPLKEFEEMIPSEE